MCKASSFGILTELHLFPPHLIFLSDFSGFIASGQVSSSRTIQVSELHLYTQMHIRGRLQRRWRVPKSRHSLVINVSVGCQCLLGLSEVRKNSVQVREKCVRVSLLLQKKFKQPFWVFQCAAIKMFSFFSILK